MSGPCVIRELPPDRVAIEEFLERLPCRIEWCGEGIPGLTQKVLMALLKANRHQPSSATRGQILTEQNDACNLCGATFQGDLEWDHVTPLHSTCQGIEQVFRACVLPVTPRRPHSRASRAAHSSTERA